MPGIQGSHPRAPNKLLSLTFCSLFTDVSAVPTPRPPFHPGMCSWPRPRFSSLPHCPPRLVVLLLLFDFFFPSPQSRVLFSSQRFLGSSLIPRAAQGDPPPRHALCNPESCGETLLFWALGLAHSSSHMAGQGCTSRIQALCSVGSAYSSTPSLAP